MMKDNNTTNDQQESIPQIPGSKKDSDIILLMTNDDTFDEATHTPQYQDPIRKKDVSQRMI